MGVLPAVAAASTTTAAAAAATEAAGALLWLEAIAAVNRAITAGLEGNLGFFAASRAGCAEHFAARATKATAASAETTTTAAAVGASRTTAVRAASGLIREALRLVELLLAGSKGEGIGTIGTGQGFVVVRHRRPPKN
jgi:hypothetical protein